MELRNQTGNENLVIETDEEFTARNNAVLSNGTAKKTKR
jgi:hypothetical protein